jgi:hypothetical protein
MGKIGPRNGALKKLAPLNIHDCKYHFREGALVRELSRTQPGHILDSGGTPVTQGTVEKTIYSAGQPPVSMRSRPLG